MAIFMQLAKLTDEEAEPIVNMKLLGANLGKKHRITLTYGSKGVFNSPVSIMND